MEPHASATQLVVPFCYGTVAVALPKRATPDAHSHRWMVYVRGPGGEDLSPVVSKVTFGLHPSFAQAQRVCTRPPYEVTETGWGEFDITITIDLVPEAQSRPVELVHSLKLYHVPGDAAAAATAAAAAAAAGAGGPGSSGVLLLGDPAVAMPAGAGGSSSTQPVVRDRHDELVFVHPSPSLAAMVARVSSLPRVTGCDPSVAALGPHSDADELWRIAAARRAVQQQGGRIKQQLALLGGA